MRTPSLDCVAMTESSALSGSLLPSSPRIRHVAVVGGGTMGGGIAMCFANAGIPVILLEISSEALERGLGSIRRNYAASMQKGKMSEAEMQQRLALITGSADYADLAQVDLVIEAVFENPDIKKEVFRRLDAVCKPGAILATNTSSLSIAALAGACTDKSRVVGVHFFNPVPVLKLVELVPSLLTSTDTISRAVEFAEGTLNKRVIRSNDRAGFIVNALLVPYILSGVRMMESGYASAEDIDLGIVEGCAHPMGPLRLADLIGLDTIVAIAESLYAEFKEPLYAAPPLLSRMVDAGLLGRKAGRGFYDYTKK